MITFVAIRYSSLFLAVPKNWHHNSKSRCCCSKKTDYCLCSQNNWWNYCRKSSVLISFSFCLQFTNKLSIRAILLSFFKYGNTFQWQRWALLEISTVCALSEIDDESFEVFHGENVAFKTPWRNGRIANKGRFPFELFQQPIGNAVNYLTWCLAKMPVTRGSFAFICLLMQQFLEFTYI